MSATVQFIQRILPDYRTPFFEALHARLAEHRMELNVFYGQEAPGSVPRSQDCSARWARRITNKYYRRGSLELVWQPCFSQLKEGSLIVIEQANRLAINYPLLAGLRPRQSRVAFWGHGRNFQADRAGIAEAFKKTIARLPDWWFAYTSDSAAIVTKAGYPAERITVVQNAVDDSALRRGLTQTDEAACAALRSSLAIQSDRICAYCGGLYEGKRLDLLMEASDKIRERVPDFHLLIIGSGPLESFVSSWARTRPWVRMLGHVAGERLAPYLKISRLLLIPGAVGLAVVDSFVTERPLVTCEGMPHGPELSYLIDGVNGVLAPPAAESYAAATVQLLTDQGRREKLVQGCRRSAATVTLDEMVERFARGLTQWAAHG